jgi:hypothetical protein
MSELLTRLNPKTARFDIGSGGRQELSDQDIAAALGMVENKTGAMVLEYLHCASDQRQFQIESAIFGLIRREQEQRVEAVVTAEIAFHLAAGRKGSLYRVREYTAAKQSEWPPMTGETARLYVRLVFAVLSEIRAGNQCKTCNGHGVVPSGEGNLTCDACSGSGTVHEPQRARAASMGVPLASYQRNWAEPYRWLLSELTTSMAEASRQFRDSLGKS